MLLRPPLHLEEMIVCFSVTHSQPPIKANCVPGRFGIINMTHIVPPYGGTCTLRVNSQPQYTSEDPPSTAWCTTVLSSGSRGHMMACLGLPSSRMVAREQVSRSLIRRHSWLTLPHNLIINIFRYSSAYSTLSTIKISISNLPERVSTVLLDTMTAGRERRAGVRV